MNKDDILKKILLNMNYDSKKTLSENKILLNMNHDSKKTLSKNKDKIFLNEQTIPAPFNKTTPPYFCCIL